MNYKKFEETINSAGSIIISSHLNPDYDAVCSSLLLYETIIYNFPQKQVVITFEDIPYNIQDLKGHEKIKNLDFMQALKNHSPDCVIILDTNKYKKVTRQNEEKIKKYLQDYKIKTIVIDHHEIEGSDDFSLSIQDPSIPAATQLVYELCSKKMGLTMPPGSALTAMVGIISDSGLFSYPYENYSNTFNVVNELVGAGATVPQAASIVNRIQLNHFEIIAELATNISTSQDFAYSFISDSFVKKWQQKGQELSGVKSAYTIFVNRYITNVDGKKWGFIIYPDIPMQGGRYRASFRSKCNETDVSSISKKLGGRGGHKLASGVTFEAKDMQDAISKIKSTIDLVR